MNWPSVREIWGEIWHSLVYAEVRSDIVFLKSLFFVCCKFVFVVVRSVWRDFLTRDKITINQEKIGNAPRTFSFVDPICCHTLLYTGYISRWFNFREFREPLIAKIFTLIHMSICTNESTTKIAKLNSRELKICKNLGQIRENICTRKYWRIQYNSFERRFKIVVIRFLSSRTWMFAPLGNFFYACTKFVDVHDNEQPRKQCVS